MPGRQLILFLLAGLAACGPPSPTAPGSDVPGRYEVSYWHFTAGTQDIDVLKGGGRLVLDLAKDHTVTGEFFIPAGVAPEKSEAAEDMAGTWRLDQGVVRFEQEADTYIRFVDWSIGDRKLESRVANGPWDIHTILRKIGP